MTGTPAMPAQLIRSGRLMLPLVLQPYAGFVAALILFAAAPFVLNSYQLTLFATGAAYSIGVLGVSVGFASVGMLALSQPAMMVIAGYIVTYLISSGTMGFVPATLAACVVCAVIAMPLGWLTSRLDRFSYAVLSFSFTYLVSMLLSSNSLVKFTGGELGRPFPRATLLGAPLSGWLAYVFLAVVVILAFCSAAVIFRSTFGRKLLVMSVDDVVAKSVGVNVYWHKIALTVVVSLYGVLSGVMISQTSGFISPMQYDATVSISLLVMALVGGSRYFFGSFAGAMLLQVIPALFDLTQDDRDLLVGTVLLVCLAFLPEGVLSLPRAILRRRIGKRF
jgi:branched-chain amino acid transport system permease protein